VMVVVVVFQAETIAKICNFMLTLHILFDVLFRHDLINK